MKPVTLKPLPRRYPLLTDIDAIDRAGLGALVAGDAGRQIVAMKAAISRRNRDRQFGISKCSVNVSRWGRRYSANTAV